MLEGRLILFARFFLFNLQILRLSALRVVYPVDRPRGVGDPIFAMVVVDPHPLITAGQWHLILEIEVPSPSGLCNNKRLDQTRHLDRRARNYTARMQRTLKQIDNSNSRIFRNRLPLKLN